MLDPQFSSASFPAIGIEARRHYMEALKVVINERS